MRSYDEYCAMAKSLDVVGDRWTLLIVRELALSGACRYTDLRNGLPSIATNLLADRLRELERSGVIAREDAPPPIATTLFRLTPEEALAGVTRSAAQALGLNDRGRLAAGARADLVLWDIGELVELAYAVGANPLRGIMRGGHIVRWA